MKLLIFTFYFLLFTFVTPALAQAATLSLSPASGTFNKGCAFNLEIKLDTGAGGKQTDGTDAIILYDSSRLTATNITSGTIYADYPGNNIDDTAGKVTVSGLASVSSAFTGTGTLATVNFTVKDTAGTGATIVKFDFEQGGKTTDSNVVERNTVLDILSSVFNGNYIIGSGACGAGASPAPSVLPKTGQGGQGEVSVATPPAQPKTIDQLVDKTGKGPGTSQLTFTIAILGSVLTVLGILGLAVL